MSNKKDQPVPLEINATQCKKDILPILDVLELTSGKWRISIVMVLMCAGAKKFKELQRELHGISAKVLSGELKLLEQNQIISRKIFETYPVSVEYSLTEYGRTLEKVVTELREWGLKHRDRIMNSPKQK
jgi:DNA-binding HxlR family transcriptional regulator